MKISLKSVYKMQALTSNLALIVDNLVWNFLGADGYWKPELTGEEHKYFHIKKLIFSGENINTSIPVERFELHGGLSGTINPGDNSPFLIPISDRKFILIYDFNNESSNKEFKVIVLNIEGTTIKSAAIDSDGLLSFKNIDFPMLAGKIDENKIFLLGSDYSQIISINDNVLSSEDKQDISPPISVYLNGGIVFRLNSDTIISFFVVEVDGTPRVKFQVIKININNQFIVDGIYDINFPENVYLRSYFLGGIPLTENRFIIAYDAFISDIGNPYLSTDYSFAKQCMVVEFDGNGILSQGNEINFYEPIPYESIVSNPGLFVPDAGVYLSPTPDGQYVLASYSEQTEQPPFGSITGIKTMAKSKLLKINGKNINILQSIDLEEERQSFSNFVYQVGYLSLSKNSFLYALMLGEKGYFYYIITIKNDALYIKKIDKFIDDVIDVFNIDYYNNFFQFITTSKWTRIYSSVVLPPVNFY